MTRVWYCANCGYEVHSRGRCHSCREKLTASPMPELAAGSEEDEVGYRIEGWSEGDRGRLIVALNDLGIHHRFEDEELVVDASDETRVDDLVAVLGDGADTEGAGIDGAGIDGVGIAGAGGPGRGAAADGYGYVAAGDDSALDDLHGSGPLYGGPGYGGVDPGVAEGVQLLADAAGRLRRDPTDMQADADVAEASTAVFLLDEFGPLDATAWSAVGRVTRRLLAMLGADEAMDEGISREAAILERLLAPVAADRPDAAAPAAGTATGDPGAGDPAAAGALGGAVGGAPVGPAEAGGAGTGERTVYELADWLPEQRAALGLLLEEAGIGYEWDGDDLLVPAEREDQVEELFGRVEGADTGDDEESDELRYQAVAELFAACGRLAGDPGDESKRDSVVEWAREAEGPPLLGMDEVDWFRIVNRTRSLVAAIDDGTDTERIHQEAGSLHDLLRPVV